MSETTHQSPRFRANRFLLLQILFLDLVGFSLIFPLVPDLLEYYLRTGRGGVDAWLPSAMAALQGILPEERRQETIVLAGGLLSSLYAFLNFLVAPYWGRLSDRIGRRPVLLMTAIGLGLSYLFWFFSTSFTLFLLSRVIGGIMSGNLGVASAAMADMSTPEQRARDMGLLGAAFGMGFIIGPVVGGLGSQIDLTAYFPEGPLNPFSFAALIACGLSLLSAFRNAVGFTETLPVRGPGEHPWVTNPVAHLVSMRGTGMNRVLIINFLYLLVFSGWEFTFTFFYKLDFGLGPAAIGFIFLYVGVIVALGQGVLVRRLSGRAGERTLALVGLWLMPLPLFAFGFTAPAVGLSLLVLAPIALASSLIAPALAAMVSLMNATDRQGLALGIFRSSGSLARAFGPILGGVLFRAVDVRLTYLVFALVICVAGLIAFSVAPGRRPAYPPDYA